MLEKMTYLLVAVACSMALSCGRLSPAVPTEVEIDWPDAGAPAVETPDRQAGESQEPEEQRSQRSHG